MKEYELTIVFHPDLEMSLDPAIDKVKKIIESANGKITKEENEGKKRLAYAIGGQEFGIYYFINVSLEAESPSKISSTFNITDEILRYLLVKVDPRKAKAEELRKAQATKEKDASDSSEEEEE